MKPTIFEQRAKGRAALWREIVGALGTMVAAGDEAALMFEINDPDAKIRVIVVTEEKFRKVVEDMRADHRLPQG
jgi:hypothetical protein